MKRTIDRRMVGTDGNDLRFALTFTSMNSPSAVLDLDANDVVAALAMAADFVQACLVPDSVLGAAAPRHPQDYALCQRLSDGGLVRIALTTQEQFEALSAAGYRYVTGAHTEEGKLIPTFWTLPIVDLRCSVLLPSAISPRATP